MKKVIVLLAFMVAGLVQAQSISKHALGLRLGDNDGFGGEISYQRALGASNRLEGEILKTQMLSNWLVYTNGFGT
jgi:hypothetical protein